MWVRTYIARLSAARAALYGKRACIAGHYGNSRASGKQEFCPPLRKAAEAQREGEKGDFTGAKTLRLTRLHTMTAVGCLTASPLRLQFTEFDFQRAAEEKGSNRVPVHLVCRGPGRTEGAFARITFTIHTLDIYSK